MKGAPLADYSKYYSEDYNSGPTVGDVLCTLFGYRIGFLTSCP